MTYSPALPLAAATLGIGAAVWAFRCLGRRTTLRTVSCVLLLLLAAYQAIKVFVCIEPPVHPLLPRLAFLIIPWLPPISLLLLAQLSSPRSRAGEVASYALLGVASGLVLRISRALRFVTGSVRNIVFTKHATHGPRFLIHGWYDDWIGQLGIILLSAWGASRADHPVSAYQLGIFLVGTLSFAIPSTLGARFFRPAQEALPSILCPFALIIGGLLVWWPGSCRRRALQSTGPGACVVHGGDHAT